MSWRLLTTAPLAVLVAAFFWACDGDEPDVVSPAIGDASLGYNETVDAKLAGAIFTTTPDGGIVNENVRYERKIEVYLDGGPPPNAPQTAAGLPDDWYVFQVTNPSGWVLLSQDPAKCRVFEVREGIIIRLVPPSEFGLGLTDFYTVGNGRNAEAIPCHIQDEPDGVAGPSGQHDTNTDTDYGDNGAIVVQLMPFLDTPNPGGVYKAWVTPFARYMDRGGDLDETPSKYVKKKGVVQGFDNDPGFGPPRSDQKTDNFKVKEVPPRIKVFKFEDLDGDGMKDEGEPAITGWEIEITETLFDGSTVTNTCYTPCDRAVAPNSTVTVTEILPNDMWELSYVTVDEIYVMPPTLSVDVDFVSGDVEHTVVFGNWKYAEKNGYKFHDLDADGMWDKPGEPGLAGWTIKLDGKDGKGNNVNLSTKTVSSGFYKFLVPPGTYDVSEDCSDQPGWYQSAPAAANYQCGAGKYENLTFQSGDVDANNDFGNFVPVKIDVRKFYDIDGDGVQDANEKSLPDVEFCLYDGDGNLVSADDFVGSAQDACQDTDANGDVSWTGLLPGDYTVKETLPDGFFPTKTQVFIDGTLVETLTGSDATMADLLLDSQQFADLFFGDVFNCVGLTPGYWKNWRNHYTYDQFMTLLAGTIAPTIAEADAIFAEYDASDPQDLTILKAFTLANQLTLNLTQHPELPNPSEGSLFPGCTLKDYPDAPTLGEALEQAVAIIEGESATDEEILFLKDVLDRYANQKWVVY